MGSEPEAVTPDEHRAELAGVAAWWNLPLVVIDTETTSADPLEARIVQVACLAVYPDGKVSDSSYQTIVNAGVPIPDEVVAVHGISQARTLNEGIPLTDALYEVLRRLDRWARLSPVVIYNAPFDWPLIWEELGRTDLVWTDPLADVKLLDPLVIERQFNGISKGHYSNKLSDVAKRYGLTVADAHDAPGDCVMAASILRAQVTRYELLRKLSIDELQQRQRSWYSDWRDGLNAYNAKKGKAWRVSGEWPFGDRRRKTP
jgi:DNA polymerase-3 subunit epsilon